MTPKIHDAATVEAAKRIGRDAANISGDDIFIIARFREGKEQITETADRIIDEHIAGQAERIKQVLEIIEPLLKEGSHYGEKYAAWGLRFNVTGTAQSSARVGDIIKLRKWRDSVLPPAKEGGAK